MRSDVPIHPTAVMQRTCKDCGATFYMTVGEQEFFRDRNLSLPNRCRHCRQDRKRAEAYQRGEL